MGGNALSCTSVRMTKNNYERMAAECVAKLKALYPSARVNDIVAYRSKPDFGDLDIALDADNYDPYQAAAALDAVEVVRNGPVTSIGVLVRPEVPHREGNVFQVDLIKLGTEEFEFSFQYYSNNDAGNLAGRVAKSMFTSLRHDGLYFYHRAGDYKFREILLTRDYGKALAFLGYDPARFAEGFESLEDIFKFIASTEFFTNEIFLLENRNYTARVRDRKRKTYCEFLKWCEVTPGLSAYEFPEDKSVWLPRIIEHFPQFEIDYAQSLTDLAEQQAVKAKFNGEWVTQLTGFQGKELGFLMKRFKESFESVEAQRAFVLGTSLAGIEARVRQVQAEMAT
jgi:hypothetical protein